MMDKNTHNHNRLIQVLGFHNNPIIRKNLEIKSVSHYKFVRKHERVLQQLMVFASGQINDYDFSHYQLTQPSCFTSGVYIVKEGGGSDNDATDDEDDEEEGAEWVINSRNWDDFPIQVRTDFKQIYREGKGAASFIDWEHFAPFNQYQQYRKNYLQNLISQRDTEKYFVLRDHKPTIPDELSNLILSYL